MILHGGAGLEKRGESPISVCVRTCAVPSGLVPFCHLHPALPCRAIICRPLRGWNLLAPFHCPAQESSSHAHTERSPNSRVFPALRDLAGDRKQHNASCEKY